MITSDHESLIGERGFLIPIRLYDHLDEFYYENLITDPLVEIGGRVEILFKNQFFNL